MHCEYGTDSCTDADVKKMMSEGAVVKFYATWCGHCQTMAEEWKKFVADHKSNVNIIDVESENNEKFLKIFPKLADSAQGFPTIIFAKDGESKRVFEGERVADKFAEFAKKKTGGGSRSNKKNQGRYKMAGRTQKKRQQRRQGGQKRRQGGQRKSQKQQRRQGGDMGALATGIIVPGALYALKQYISGRKKSGK
jgi:thiol-disulfide isomerase/thioredoxin